MFRKRSTLDKMLHDWTGTVDDALGLVMEVSIFTLIFAFAGVLIGSAGAQAMSEIAAHHIASLSAVDGPDSAMVLQEAQNDAHAYLQAQTVAIVHSQASCGTASACVVISPCSAAFPVCVVIVERRVMIPVANSTVTWTAKAVSIWPQNA